MERNTSEQGPSGSDTGNHQKTATNPRELANKEAGDPNQTAGEDAESGAGYGNHAMPPVENGEA